MLKQLAKSVLCLLVTTSAVLVLGASAFAQLSPPISPWMGMFDRPSNPTLGNYLGNVRPQQDMRRTAAAYSAQIQSQQQALQSLQQGSGGMGGGAARSLATGSAGPASTGGAASMRDVLAPPREIPSVQRNPAGFNQYLHYYPSNSLSRKPVPNFSRAGRKR